MKISLLILGGVHSSSSSLNALRFAKASLAKGHTIYRVFFYNEGVQVANKLICAPQGQTELHNEWTQLIDQHQLDAVTCIASAVKRGIINESEAKRYGLGHDNLSENFDLSGLGQLLDASKESDRLVSFGC